MTAPARPLITTTPSSPRARMLAKLGPKGMQRWINRLPEAQLRVLPYLWREFWARDTQLAPSGPWRIWAMFAGRGNGKTRTGAEWVRERVNDGARAIALVGKTPDHVRNVMIEGTPLAGIPGLLDVFPPEQRPVYEPGLRRVTFHTGAIATTFSGAEPNQLRGPGHDTVWVDELSAFMHPKDTWDNVELTARVKGTLAPRICITTTPKPVYTISELYKRAKRGDPLVRVTGGSTYDNTEFLDEGFFAELKQAYEGTSVGRQELYGDVLDQAPGALWREALIDNARIKDIPLDRLAPVSAYSRRLKLVPALARIVIGIDPATTADEESNETGIIAAAIDHRKPPHAYILADVSWRWTPEEWGRLSCNLLKALQGDRIVAETNQGGLLVERNLRVVNPNVPYRGVHATQGKRTRAEPVASLYEQGRVHHVGVFPELEYQLRTWEPGEPSPDRLDALVWALWELLVSDEMVMLEAMQLNF